MRLRFDERHLGALRPAGSLDELPARLDLCLSVPIDLRLLVRPRLAAEGTLACAALGGRAPVAGQVSLEGGELCYALRVDAGAMGVLSLDARKSGFGVDLLAAVSTLGGRIARPDGSMFGSLLLRFDPRDDLRAARRSLRLER